MLTEGLVKGTLMGVSARYLVFNGAIVLLIGLLCGAPYGRAVVRQAPPHIVHSWRVAHLSLPIGATLMFEILCLIADRHFGTGRSEAP